VSNASTSGGDTMKTHTSTAYDSLVEEERGERSFCHFFISLKADAQVLQ